MRTVTYLEQVRIIDSLSSKSNEQQKMQTRYKEKGRVQGEVNLFIKMAIALNDNRYHKLIVSSLFLH